MMKIKIIKEEEIKGTYYIKQDEKNKNEKKYIQIKKETEEYKVKKENKRIFEIKGNYKGGNENYIYISEELAKRYDYKNEEKVITSFEENVTIFEEVYLLPENEKSKEFYENKNGKEFLNLLLMKSSIFYRDEEINLNFLKKLINNNNNNNNIEEINNEKKNEIKINKEEEKEMEIKINKKEEEKEIKIKEEEEKIEYKIIETIPSLIGIISEKTKIKILEIKKNQEKEEENMIIKKEENKMILSSSFIKLKEKIKMEMKVIIENNQNYNKLLENYSKKLKINENSIGFVNFKTLKRLNCFNYSWNEFIYNEMKRNIFIINVDDFYLDLYLLFFFFLK
jgi:hypothetical protein